MKRREFIIKTGISVIAVPSTIRINGADWNHVRVINDSVEKKKFFGDGRDWFVKKRFGMFVHWGLYAIPGWHEQHIYRLKVPRQEYQKLAGQWNPIDFDPDHWLDVLQETGMEYLCITTKHIDGFCLWDTKQTSFNAINTPYGKDIIGMIAEACHKRGVPLCLYYSIADFNHPNYPHQGRPYELVKSRPDDNPDQELYLEFIREQIKELCTNYGTIHGIWWDANKLSGYKETGFNQMIRKLQPNAVINNRGFEEGDFSTPERDFFEDNKRELEGLVEACQSVGMESWGYRENEDYYTNKHLIKSIDRYFSRGANYLLNIGPDSKGNIPHKQGEILKVIGKWYHKVKESFEDTIPVSYLTTNKDVMLTKKENNLYVHLNADTPGNVVKLKPITIVPLKATLLNNGEKVDFEVQLTPRDFQDEKAYLRLIKLPVNEMCNTVLVIRLEFNRDPENNI